MKIEKINDNQIKCTLNKTDLASRQIKLSELAYGTEKAKSLFRDMIQQASEEFGFEAEDIPLMIEAIPVSADCIVLVITKVEDPEELDTRFSRFAPSDEDLEDMEGIESSEPPVAPTGDFTTDLIDMLNAVKNKMIAAANEKKKDGFVPLPEALGAVGNKKAPEGPKVEKEKKNIPATALLKIYSFDSMSAVIEVSSLLANSYKGQNQLYKSPEDGRYYLMVHMGNHSLEDFSAICLILSEYAKGENSSPAFEAYAKEHFTKIIARKAIQKLGGIEK